MRVRGWMRELWEELMPPDPTGVLEILNVVMTPDARYYAYSYVSAPTDLYLVEGLRWGAMQRGARPARRSDPADP